MFKKTFFIILAVFNLQGCVTTEQVADVGAYSTNKAKLGLVVLSTTVNTREIPQISSVTLERVNPENKNKSERHYLINQMSGKSTVTSLFFGGLPSGEYKIIQVSAPAFGGSKFLDISDSKLTGNFNIVPGTVVDLGRLILTAVNTKAAVGRSKLIVNNSNLIDRFFKHEPELINPNKVTGWIEPHKTIDEVEQLALDYPQGISSFAETQDGQVIAGTNLGTTLVRSVGGKWQVLSRNENLHQISALVSYDIDDSIAIVADEYGALYRITKNGDIVTLAKGNLPDGRIVFINSSEQYDHWFVGLERDGLSELYSANSLESGLWNLERKVEIGMNVWSGMQGAWYWNRPDGIGFASSKEDTVSCFDYNKKEWMSHLTPSKRTIISVSTAEGNDSIGVLTSPGGGVAGIFAKTHISDDCGKSWLEIDSPYTVKFSAPLVVKDKFILETGGVFSDEGIYASKDNGKSWFKITSEKYLTERLWMSKSNGLFSVTNGAYGFETLENSKDLGSTWELEFSSFIIFNK
ncbi:hypothetical protein [Shewanella sp. SR44-3]|uniref:hypothetical protein n=1 Tax=unclassified Shewanella TaxID=196818 RepID=UPI0015FA77A7|nr:hypothetical protein [Shewanella sp. SR44-3]MBB1270099.1 hypothetical protein [Shewanella sp. SR44-3]